jgi:nuclear pore complex protein Nup93
MSLFGAPTGGASLKRSQTQPLFPSTAPSQPASSGLFNLGGSTLGSTTPKPSPFGTVPTLSLPQAGGTGSSHFGAAPASAPQATSSLFGAAAPASQAPKLSTFGGFGAPTAAAPTASSQPLSNSSLFASTNVPATRPPTLGSLLGGNTAPTGGSLFATQPPGTSAPSLGGGGLLGVAPPGAGSTADVHGKQPTSYFDHLLERGKKRATMEGGIEDLPMINLGLADIARKARNLGTGGPSAADAKEGLGRA